MAAALLPHPQKADRGGEDAVFLADDSLSFGKSLACWGVNRLLLFSCSMLLGCLCGVMALPEPTP